MRLRLRREKPDQHLEHLERYASMLAHTAEMEMSLGMGSWRDTVSQMNEILDQLARMRSEHRSAEDELIRQMKARISRLESVLHRREMEYDELQERFCQMQGELARRPTA